MQNFKYLDDLIHSGLKEIVLTSDILFNEEIDEEYMEGIELDVDNLVIDGNGHTIDANRKAMIFWCTGNNVVIKNLTLTGYDMNCDVMDNSGELTIIDSMLMGHYVPFGTIHNTGVLNITNSTLDCARIKNWNGILNITNSILKNNRVDLQCGAIDNSGGLITITNSIISNNFSFHSSGAISNKYGIVDISCSKIINNFTHARAGAIYNNGVLNIINSIVSDNTAKGSGRAHGGAIFNDECGELNIINSTLSNNKADIKGGAIYTNNLNYKLNCCTIKNNEPNNVYDV